MAATPKHAGRVLGLDETASVDDVRRVRKAMAFAYHPDRSADQVRATRHMARLNAAADTLIAHIKSKKLPVKNGKRPHFPEFSRPHPTNTSGTAHKPSPKRAPAPKPAPPKNHPLVPATTRNVAVHVTDQKTTSQLENDLVQFASASYVKVLGEIGSNNSEPKLNVRVLKFQNNPKP